MRGVSKRPLGGRGSGDLRKIAMMIKMTTEIILAVVLATDFEK